MENQFVDRHQIGAFLLVAFGWTWTWDALYYAFDWGATLPVNLGRQWGVPLAAVVVVGASDASWREWVARVSRWRLRLGVYLFAVLFPLFVTNVQQVVRALGRGTLTYSPPGSTSEIALFVLANVFLMGGVEEIGWRGFLQPRLQERLSVLTAGLAVGVVWLAWHLPLFLGRANYVLEPVPFVRYAVFIVGASAVYGALVNVTDGAVFPLMAIHAVGNLGPLLSGSGGAFDSPLVSLVVGSGLWWSVVLVLVGLYGRSMVPATSVTSLPERRSTPPSDGPTRP